MLVPSQLRARVAIGAVIFMTSLGWLWAPAVRASEVLIERGAMPGFRWHVAANRGPKSKVGEVICLRVKIIPGNPESELPLDESACADPRSRPIMLSLVDEFDHPNATVLGMAFAKKVVSVTLHFRGRVPTREVSLHLPSGSAKRRLGMQIRLGATAFLGQSCVKRIVGHTRSGPVAYDSGPMHCNG